MAKTEHKDSVRDQTSTAGTGTMTCDGVAPGGSNTVAASHTSGATVAYRVQNSANTVWEVGKGVVTITTGVASVTRPAANVTAGSSGAGVNVTLSGTNIVITGPVASDLAIVNQMTEGTTASGAVVLTAASFFVQKITFTGFGQTVQLPDATTMQRGAAFILHNASEFPGRVIDSTGVMRGVLQPQRVAVIGLTDNSTAAGGWDCTSCELVGVTAQIDIQSASVGSTGAFLQVIDLDASRQLLLAGDTAVYAVCYNKSTNTWGTPVLVRSSITDTSTPCFSGIKTATDQVMVTSVASLTALQAVVLSISTLTITVNTPTGVTLGGNISQLGTPILVGTGWVVPYTRATTTVGIRAITISGTTPTIGAETALTAGGSFLPHLYASSSVVLCLGPNADSATTIYVKPFTLSGTTLTAGTAQTVGASTSADIRSLVFGTRWLFIYNDASVVNASLVSISAGNATVSTVTSIIAANAAPSACDAIVCNSKIVVSSPTVASASGYFQILTDTAGTLSKGTAVQCIDSNTGAAAISASGTTCRFADTLQSFSVSASGASPVVTVTGGGDSSKLNGHFPTTDEFGCTRVQPQVFNPGNLIFSGANGLGFSSLNDDYLLIPAAGPAGNFAVISSTVDAAPSTSARSSTTEFWLFCVSGPSGLTVTLQRIEAAQP